MSTLPELAPSPPHIIGPTWQKTADGGWHLPEMSLGWGILNWWAEYVKTPGGDHSGEAFMPTLEQARFTLWWYAVDENGKYAYREGLLRRLKGWGKDPYAAALALAELCGPVAFSHFSSVDGQPVGKPRHAAWVQVAAVSQDQPLALDTEVPTPTGWTTVGELSIGDQVIGSDGLAHTVMRETDVLNGLDCYKVKFDDGTEVVASASHGWTTERLNGHGDRYTSVTSTTEELVKSVRGPKNRKRHRIPTVGCYVRPNTDLLVDPWFLGLWLGDGATKDSSVVFDWRLRGEYEALVKPIVKDFQTVIWDQIEDNYGTFRIKNNDRKRDSESLRSQLREIGVLGNKHIPSDYMHANYEHRIALLRGLVDSDGGIDKNGRAYFVNSNRRLVHQFQELAIGLGFRCTVRNHGKDGALRAEFNPGSEYLVSNLAYKYERQIAYSARNRSQHRWIESVEKVDSVQVKCIGIDTEDHLFQVTRSRILTHNTKNTFSLFPIMISKHLKEEYGLEVNKFIIYSEAGGRIEAVTSSPASMEGNRPTFVIQNEIQWWGSGPAGEANEGHAMNEVIEGNVTKIPGSRKLAICNAHIPGYETVAEHVYDHYLAIQSGAAVDTGLLYDALEAPADTPVSEIPSEKEDPEGYEKGVQRLTEGVEIARGDSYWLPVDEIIKSVLDVKNSVTESRRKFLNQVNAHEDSWISFTEWNPLALTAEMFRLQKDERISLAFDGSKSNDWTALVACRIHDGMLFLLNYWDPEKHNGEVPREDVDAAVRSAFDRYDVVAFRADVKEFEAYVDQWGHLFKKKVKVNASPGHPIAFDMRGQQKRFALDCERFLDAVLEKEVWHDGSEVLKQHVLNARRHPTIYDAISIRKASKDSSKKIDAAVCAVLAFGARHEYLMSKNNRSGRVVILR